MKKVNNSMRQTLLPTFMIMQEEVVQKQVSIQPPITHFFKRIDREVYIERIQEELKETKITAGPPKKKPGRPPKKDSKEIAMLRNETQNKQVKIKFEYR